MVFKGTCTALVTPFDESNNIDYAATKKLIEHQIKNGVNAILVLGSTGESFAISSLERPKFISYVRSLLPQSVKLIVGAGSNNPIETINLIREAKLFGADCCLVTTPYYTKCTQNGLIHHFKTICEHSDLPIIVYNIPSRAGVNIQPKTMEKICECKNVAGLKEANGEINHILEMTNLLSGRLPIYSGNDNLNHLFLSLGASGVISVSSNVFPKEIVAMFNDPNESLRMHNKLFNFNNLMFCEPNPIPVKYALSRLNLIENNLRPPLTILENSHKKMIDEELQNLGVKHEDSAHRCQGTNGTKDARTLGKERA